MYETKIKINDFEIEADVMDADFQEKVEKYDDVLSDEIDKINDQDDKTTSGVIRETSRAYKRFFDGIFGEGASKEMFGEKDNLNETANAYIAIAKFFSNQRESFTTTQDIEMAELTADE